MAPKPITVPARTAWLVVTVIVVAIGAWCQIQSRECQAWHTRWADVPATAENVATATAERPNGC